MAKIYRLVFDTHPDEEQANRQTLGLAGIAVTLLLLVMSLWLVRHLQHQGHVEDCLMQGRTNCDILVARIR